MWGLTKKIGLVVLFYLNGIACGVVVIWLAGLGSGNQKSAQLDHPGIPVESRPAESFGSLLKTGDRAVRIGQLEQAERSYRAACDAEPNDDVVHYKLGLTYEYSGKPDAARQIYRRLAEQTELRYIDRLARLGLARIQATKGQFAYANELLWHLLVNPSHDDSVSEEAAHLLAINLGHSPFKNERLSVRNGFLNPVLPNQLISHLDFLEQRKSEPGNIQENNSVELRPEKLTLDVLTRNQEDLANCTLMINAIQVPANEILILLSDQLGFEIGVSEAAKVVIESSVREIHAAKISFTMLVHSVLAPLELGWRLNDEQLQILTLNEMAESELATFRSKQTIHLFRYALFMYPDLELAGYTRFAYANYLLRGKDELSAIRIYQDLLRLKKHLNRQVRHLASYNMGVAYQEIGQADRARRAYSWIADDSPHGDITATALISISRIDLADLKFKSSARVCARAASAADSKPLKADAVIRLAMSYALNQNYFSANNSLAFYKAVLDSPDDHDLATFLSAYSRFRANAADRRMELSAELVRSVANSAGKFADHPELAIIVAQAYDDLGFPMLAMNEMSNYLFTQPESKLQQHALEEFVRFVANAKPTDEIVTLTNRVESMFPKTNLIAISRLLHKAKQLFKDGKFEQCKMICMQILQMDQTRVLESKALSLLGFVYEKEGKHHTAALCFAGVRIDLADKEGK